MSSPVPQATEETSAVTAASSSNMRKQARGILHWSGKIAVWVLVSIAGFLLNEGLTWAKFNKLKAEDGVAKLAEEQKQEFASLRDSLAEISDAIPAANRDQLRDIRDSLGTIENQNEDLVRVLALSRQENLRVGQLASANASVGGSYSFILTENTGMPLDRNTTMGVGNISRANAVVNLSTVGGIANERSVLSAGEGVDFTGADGQPCLVSVVSISRDGAASFTVRCGQSLPA